MKTRKYVVWNADTAKLERAEPMSHRNASVIADLLERETRDTIMVLPA